MQERLEDPDGAHKVELRKKKSKWDEQPVPSVRVGQLVQGKRGACALASKYESMRSVSRETWSRREKHQASRRLKS